MKLFKDRRKGQTEMRNRKIEIIVKRRKQEEEG